MSRVWVIQGPGGCDHLGSSSEGRRGSGKLAGLVGPSKDKRMSRMRSRELTVERQCTGGGSRGRLLRRNSETLVGRQGMVLGKLELGWSWDVQGTSSCRVTLLLSHE